MMTTNMDDMLVGASSAQEVEDVIKGCALLFEITNNEELKYHLGCSIE
jgi:hypothetical protein